MLLTCFIISIICLVLPLLLSVSLNSYRKDRQKVKILNFLLVGTFLANLVMFFSIHIVDAEGAFRGFFRSGLLAVFHSMQVFTIGCDFSVIKDGIMPCPDGLKTWYLLWASALYVLAPVFTFGFVLSLFKNLTAYLKYICAFFKDAYVFSQLNEKSMALARDLKEKHEHAVIVFTDVYQEAQDGMSELLEAAEQIGAICFEKDITIVDFKKHSRRKSISFFAIGNEESDNLDQALTLIELYKTREDTHVYIFSTKLESELLLTSVDKGLVKVRRIHEVQSLVNRLLYENGSVLFESARKISDESKKISAVVVGMGCHGTEMVKALTWFGQMDGYKLEIHAFDKDPLACEKFTALAPELMSSKYNGVFVDGEAQYKINIHAGVDVDSVTFANKIAEIRDTTYVVVALGNDDVNISTAVTLRMYFERMRIHPVIYAIVYN